MEDTPANYNVANQRFEYGVEDENGASIPGQKIKKPRKSKVSTVTVL